MISIVRSSWILTSLTAAVLAIFVMVGEFSQANGQVSGQDMDEYFDFLARANHYSPLEHAGSHGTAGIGLGVGLAAYETPSNPDVMRQLWRAKSQDPGDHKGATGRVYVPRMQIHKGLPWSVDIGLGLGQVAVSGASLMSVYSQWTLFEAFALPALAIRGGYSRIMDLATTDASSVTVDGVASYGFLRIFTVYGSVGIGRHQTQVRLGESYGTTLALNGEVEGTINHTQVRKARSVGLQVQLLPPFCTVAFEGRSTEPGVSSYLAKFSVGM